MHFFLIFSFFQIVVYTSFDCTKSTLKCRHINGAFLCFILDFLFEKQCLLKKSYMALVKVTKAATWRHEDKMKAKCKLQHKVVKYERVRIP